MPYITPPDRILPLLAGKGALCKLIDPPVSEIDPADRIAEEVAFIVIEDPVGRVILPALVVEASVVAESTPVKLLIVHVSPD